MIYGDTHTVAAKADGYGGGQSWGRNGGLADATWEAFPDRDLLLSLAPEPRY